MSALPITEVPGVDGAVSTGESKPERRVSGLEKGAGVDISAM